MDPDENLKEQKLLADRIANAWAVDPNTDATFLLDDGERLAELVVALDEWIQKGGFLPKAWQKETSKAPPT